MDHCPPEILRDIIALACTDDGTTGRSLSLVSTRFHDVSLPFRYQSISILNITQLRQFVKCVLDVVPSPRLPVKYLFLEIKSPFRDPRFYATTKYQSFIEDKDVTLNGRDLMQFLSLWRSEVIPLFERVMSALSPSLVLFHLSINSATISLDRFDFPMLQEFHLLSPINCGWEATRFPQLKRLRIYTFAHDFFEDSDITGLDAIRLWNRSPDLFAALDSTSAVVKSTRKVYLEWEGKDASWTRNDLLQAYPYVAVVRSRTDKLLEDWWDSVNGGSGCFVDD